jgi:hypothetical protein
MPYTLLRVTEHGVLLWDYHLRRLALPAGSAEAEALRRFAREAESGVWAVRAAAGQGFRAEPRAGSQLRDGLPWRIERSPAAGLPGPFPKPAPPCLYDAVRREDTATLLTPPDGSEIYEACRAAVVAWDGEGLVCVPRDRPRVWSTAEAAIRDHLGCREAPIAPGAWPLLLVNAVKGTCEPGPAVRPSAPVAAGPFPAAVRAEIEALFAALTRRPE